MYTAVITKMKFFRPLALATLLLFCSWWAVACSSPIGSPNSSAAAADKPLADPDDSAKLAAGWSWNQGESQESAFKLDGGTLTVTAAAKTEQWSKTNTAPYVATDLEGDFAAQAKLDFGGPVLYTAGIGIMSADDPTQWVRLAPRGQRALGLIRNSGKEITATADFQLSPVYLKLQRRGGVISAYYSLDGATWQPVSENYEYNLPPKVKLYLIAQNPTKPISARFSEVKVTQL